MKWYRHDPAAFLEGVIGLDFEERGAYITLIDLLYARDGKDVTDDLVCKAAACRPQVWRRIKSKLVDKGKVREVGGKLTANRVETTLVHDLILRENMAVLGGRPKRKQTLKSNDTVQTTHTHTQKEDAPSAPSDDPQKELFRRGKEVAGKNAGGLIRRLLAVKGNNVALARAAIEQASQKQDPREYLGRIVSGPQLVSEMGAVI